MARRSGQPALYEMMRSPRGTGVPTSDPAPLHMPSPSADAGEDTGPSPLLDSVARLLTPGRTIRMPVGYVMLAIAIGIVLLMAAYMIGNSRGKAVTEQNFAQKLSSTPTRPGAVNDPLSQPADLTAGSGLLSSAQPDDGAASSERPGGGIRPATQWGPIEPKTDPRVKGWKYYVLAQTLPQGALRLAEFCRANRLETYVVRGKNGRHWVVAFPGFQGSSAAPEPAALLERIQAIGVKYKAHTKGGTDLSDAVPSLYDG